MEAADVHHDSGVAGLVGAAAEGLHAADFAEEVGDLLGVEAIFREHVFAREEREVGRWHEGQNKAFRLAMRTVASHRFRQVHLDLVPHCPTMTPSDIFLHSCFL